MSLNVGTVTAKFVADTSDFEARTARATEALKRVKTSAKESSDALARGSDAAKESAAASERLAQNSEKAAGSQERVAAAVAKVSARVEDLRARQLALAAALATAATAANRDEGKVAALRLELEKTTATMNRLTNAQQHSISAQSGMSVGLARTQGALGGAGAGMGNMGRATLELSRGLEDLQYGVSGVLNNIPSLVMSLGGSAGIAGFASLAAVAVSQLVKHFGDVGPAAKKGAEEAASHLEKLQEEIDDLVRSMEALARGTTVKIIKQETAKAEAQKAFDEARSQFGEERFRAGEAALAANGDPSQVIESQRQFVKPAFDDKETQAKFDEIRRLAAAVAKESELLFYLENEHQGELIKDAEDRLKADAERASKRAIREETADGLKAPSKSEMTDFVREMMSEAKAAANLSSIGNAPITADRAGLLAGMQAEPQTTTLMENADAKFLAMITTVDGLTGGLTDLTSRVDSIDLRTPLERAAEYFANAMHDLSAQGLAMKAVKGGASAAGAELGGIAGGLIGSIFGGAKLGEALGSALGGIMGKTLDALVDALGVLTPLFDGVAVVIQALQPILLVVKELMAVVGFELETLAPIVADIARPLAALLLVFVRIVEALIPFLSVVVAAAHALLVWLDAITMGVKWLDDNFFRPLVSGARHLYNGFVDIVNTIVDWGRAIFGDEFGVKLKSISEFVSPLIDSFSELTKTTEKQNNVAGGNANLPPGFRYALAAANAETPTGSAGVRLPPGAQTSGPTAPTNNFFGPVSFAVRGLSPEELDRAARQQNLKRYGRVVGGGAGGASGDSNG